MSASLLSLPSHGDRVAMDRALYSPKQTETILNISHASLYRLIGAGRLDARKLGAKTLITAESIEQLIADLPKVGRCR